MHIVSEHETIKALVLNSYVKEVNKGFQWRHFRQGGGWWEKNPLWREL